MQKQGSKPVQATPNLGERQNQQTQSAVLQLASNLLGNPNNLNQLTKKPGGGTKTIQEIEEEFLISAFQPGQSPVGGVDESLPPEIIERIWWELRPWIEEYLRDPNQSILDHAREKFRRDVENWLKWQQREHNRQLEEYQKRLQELKRIEDLIAEYQKIREQELLDKISRKKELHSKGYVDRDIEKLKEWNLITPDQEIPDLTAEKRVGATNILYTQGEEPNRIGGSCDLIIFLKPNNNQAININFAIDFGEYKNYYEQIIRNSLRERGKTNNDAYVLVRELTSARGDSAGIAFYLTLYSLTNRIPLPRNLGSTGTVYGTKMGAIGGLNRKLEYNVKKEKSIDIFILSEENKRDENHHDQSFEHIPNNTQNKIKQVHFVSQVYQIEVALQEILKTPEQRIIHSCSEDKVPERKPEEPWQPRAPPTDKPNEDKPNEEENRDTPDPLPIPTKDRDEPTPPNQDIPEPNLSITPKQFLSLAVELSIREKDGLGKNHDFYRELKKLELNHPKFKENFEEAIRLRSEYLKKLQVYKRKVDANKQKYKENVTEFNSLKLRILEFQKRLEFLCESRESSNKCLFCREEFPNFKCSECGYAYKDGKRPKVGELPTPTDKKELDELIPLIRNSKFLSAENCLIPNDLLKDGLALLEELGDYKGEVRCARKSLSSFNSSLSQFWDNTKREIGKQERILDNNKEEVQIINDYKVKFKQTASFIANIVKTMLKDLAKSGYSIQEIKWTSEFHSPSLDNNSSVSFDWTRKR